MCDTLGHMSGMSKGVSGFDRKSCPPISYWLGIPASSKRTRFFGSSESFRAKTEPAGPPPTTMKSYSTAVEAGSVPSFIAIRYYTKASTRVRGGGYHGCMRGKQKIYIIQSTEAHMYAATKPTVKDENHPPSQQKQTR